MKKTGIVRRVDDLDRIILPIEIRRRLGITEKTALEFYMDEDRVIIDKYDPDYCMLCNEKEDLVPIGRQKICRSCLEKVYEEGKKA